MLPHLFKIYEPTRENGIWITRHKKNFITHKEIIEMKIRQTGRLEEMDEIVIPKNILDGIFLSSRMRCTPSNHWENALRKHSQQLLGGRVQRRKAEDKNGG